MRGDAKIKKCTYDFFFKWTCISSDSANCERIVSEIVRPWRRLVSELSAKRFDPDGDSTANHVCCGSMLALTRQLRQLKVHRQKKILVFAVTPRLSSPLSLSDQIQILSAHSQLISNSLSSLSAHPLFSFDFILI